MNNNSNSEFSILKDSRFTILDEIETSKVNGGLYPISRWIVESIGALAAEMEENIKNNDYWYRSFSR